MKGAAMSKDIFRLQKMVTTIIKAQGQGSVVSRSYLWEFLIGGTLLYLVNKFWKNRKAKKQIETE